MHYYKLLKLNSIIKNYRVKLIGLYILHKINNRYLAVHFDPINACNLRCKMCYFTDKDYVKKLKGLFPKTDLELFSNAVLKNAIKLQIGCGTEPTLYKNIDEILTLATKNKVPYISMTTNANLLEKEQVLKWASLGLNEFTVSLHGVTKQTYEDLMNKGKFELFMKALGYINDAQKKYPNLKLRINFTFNEDNFDELALFYKTFGNIKIDTLQVRPISKIGNTEYNNFSLKKIIPKYDAIITKLKSDSQQRGVQLIAHSKEQLLKRISTSSALVEFTYCYISPTTFFHEDFNWKNEDYNQYSKRTKLGNKILNRLFSSKKEIDKLTSDKLNYSIN